jgi:predicted O-linked N-acetylglucosamine transferase (SPINDLY family)
MASVLLALGQTAPALHYAQRAADLLPTQPHFQIELARLLSIENQHPKAAAILRRALAQHPNHTGLYYQLALTLEQLELHADAEQVARDGLALDANDESLQAVLAGSLLSLGRIEECVELTRAAAQRHPHNALLASGLALMLNYLPGVTPQESLAAHRRYAQLLETTDPFPARTYTNARDPNKRLRVGILSPDLRQHSVAYFMEPWLEHLDPAQLELIVYQTNRIADAVTSRLRALVTTRARGQWQVMDNISDHALAEKIYADKVDLLIELSGHTHAHSLAAMHRRPAPVQLTYLGYPNTTGLTSIDHRIVDSHTDPAGSDSYATEKLLRLDPSFLCYRPPSDIPSPTSDIRHPTSDITFGSFNTVQKLNRSVIRTWSQILAHAPSARLLLKGGHPDDHGLRAGVLARFKEAGADPARIDFLPRTKGTREHLALYSCIDIALDPFPYNGTTTTCEALLMGVPVISLAGSQHPGRVGVSILTNVGHPELIAESEPDYIARALALANDPARLTQLRATLRSQLLASPLCDPVAFSRRMESALRTCWSTWCAAR